MMDTYHYTFTQIHRMHTTKRRPWSKLWTLGGSAVSLQVHQLQRIHHSGSGCWWHIMHMWGTGSSGNFYTFLFILLWTKNCSKKSSSDPIKAEGKFNFATSSHLEILLWERKQQAWSHCWIVFGSLQDQSILLGPRWIHLYAFHCF